MSIHIGAKEGEIAKTVLMPGDPLRAKFIAEKYLTDAKCYNQIRGMYGYTGKYKGREVSIQGSGMGIPSISIYSNELMMFYGVKTLIRIGSCGSIQPDIKVRDIILASTASTDSSVNKLRFKGMDYSPTADFDLLKKAYDCAQERKIAVRVGNILSSDTFYNEDPDEWKLWAKYKVLAIEMEATALYTLAARHGCRALCVLTVSDSLVSGDKLSSDDRERSFTQMVEIALEASA